MSFLGRTIHAAGRAPKHLITDKGGQFWCEGFKAWCRRHNIKPRFGAVGKHGSVAVVERFILTLKQVLRQLPLIPLRRESFRREMAAIAEWYNEHRPHMTLGGKTPNEVYEASFPRIASRESNHAQVGHADRRVPDHGRLLEASPGNGSTPPSPSTRNAATYPS